MLWPVSITLYAIYSSILPEAAAAWVAFADEETVIDNVGFDIVVVAVTLAAVDEATIIGLVEDAFDVTSIFSSLSSMLEFSLKNSFF